MVSVLTSPLDQVSRDRSRHNRFRSKRKFEATESVEQDDSYRPKEPTAAQRRRSSIWQDIRPTAGSALQTQADSCYLGNEQHSSERRSHLKETKRRNSKTVQGSSRTYLSSHRLDPKQTERFNKAPRTLDKPGGVEILRGRPDGKDNASTDSMKRADQTGSIIKDRREPTRRPETRATVCSNVAGWAASVSPAMVRNGTSPGLSREQGRIEAEAIKSSNEKRWAVEDEAASHVENTHTSPCVATESKMPNGSNRAYSASDATALNDAVAKWGQADEELQAAKIEGSTKAMTAAERTLEFHYAVMCSRMRNFMRLLALKTVDGGDRTSEDGDSNASSPFSLFSPDSYTSYSSSNWGEPGELKRNPVAVGTLDIVYPNAMTELLSQRPLGDEPGSSYWIEKSSVLRGFSKLNAALARFDRACDFLRVADQAIADIGTFRKGHRGC
ncbi:MAG: hypothetical protein Q9182_006412 [Xanthomendoza sp. 2 TL-2023]